MVTPVNLLGLPAVAVPVADGASGSGGAVRIIGARFREGLCLAAAEVIEATTGGTAICAAPRAPSA